MTSSYRSSRVDGRVNKGALCERVAERLKTDIHTADACVSAVLEEVCAALVNGETVMVTGFGSLRPHTTPERMGRNPATGETVKIPENKVARYRPSERLTRQMNGKSVEGEGVFGKAPKTGTKPKPKKGPRLAEKKTRKKPAKKAAAESV